MLSPTWSLNQAVVNIFTTLKMITNNAPFTQLHPNYLYLLLTQPKTNNIDIDKEDWKLDA